MSDYQMEPLVLIIFEISLVEWDSLIRRLSHCRAHITWVDVILIGLDSTGELALIVGRMKLRLSPWVVNPTRFSNQYYRLLLRDIWKPRKWDGPFQYEATVAGTKLMMLPTDVS